MEKSAIESVNACHDRISTSKQIPLSSANASLTTLRPILNYLTVPEVKNLGAACSIIENHYKNAEQRISLAFLFFLFVVSLLISIHLFPVYLFDRVNVAFYQKAIIRFIHSKDMEVRENLGNVK
ncbi:hypothetical protein [Pseudobutyrivibrio ruminis]|uniref:hypothetical protein n=1 Tax=Pseudobutyrivibrio ruminis TaxID=46206 RepID=UPI00117AD416|nr:hypothetical protein [Pseudobutyrivibrio ruminis]